MPLTCSICSHEEREKIDRELVRGASLRDIAGRYETAKSSLDRHRPHILRAVSRNAEVREAARTGALLDDVRAGEGRAERLYQYAEEILADALKEKDRRGALLAVRTAVAVMGEARSYLELRGELTGEINKDGNVATMAVQILCPQTQSDLPRVAWVPANLIDDDCEEIGVLQRS